MLKYLGPLIPHFPLRFLWRELPMDQGWAYHAALMENDPIVRFSGAKVVNGYISQEVKKLMAQFDGK